MEVDHTMYESIHLSPTYVKYKSAAASSTLGTTHAQTHIVPPSITGHYAHAILRLNTNI